MSMVTLLDLRMMVSPLTGLVSLLCLAPAVTISPGDSSDCGVFGWAVPEPPSGAKLMQVHAIIRHGDRTPTNGQFCWPSDSAVWNCRLNSAQVPIFYDSMYGPIFPRLYRKVFDSNGEVLNGNCSAGQLTVTGFEQHLLNGFLLKKSYVDSGFLASNITPSEIYIRSDDVPRTLQSAESLMLAMFPPLELKTEVVELHTLDTMYDYMTANPSLCPKFKEYQEEFRNSPVWMKHQNVTKAVLNAISKAINFTVGEDDLDHFANCLRTHKCHDQPWPQGMTEELYNMTWQEFSWQMFNMFAYPSVQANAQVGIGFLLKEIWQNMNKSVEKEQIQKFLLYSGHDTTLIPILVAFQVDTMMWPPYASMMLIELYEMKEKHYVRVIYNGDVLPLTFCDSSTLCDFDTFSDYMKTVTPSNFPVNCEVSQSL